ncbi:MAG: hypothetical protein ACI8P9_004427 [Parasphingorhabdus sp.]
MGRLDVTKNAKYIQAPKWKTIGTISAIAKSIVGSISFAIDSHEVFIAPLFIERPDPTALKKAIKMKKEDQS